ncbi:MAG: hypothetical protein FWH48_04435 [Oscillospiraceae bacterium]|nr:hypothetical protein [Oscillospiraceae bacterium]
MIQVTTTNFKASLGKYLALVMAAALLASVLSACEISVISRERESGEDLKAPMPTSPADAQQPSGNIDSNLIGTWTNGGSTLQVRKILTGKYDIKKIGFSGDYAVSGISYTFNKDGTYMKIVLGLSVLIITEGQYSVSDNIITLTNNTSNSTTKDEVPIVWESASNLADESHSFEIIFRESLNLDILYLDGNNSEPAVGYWFGDDEV